jgi:hypothetical protein
MITNYAITQLLLGDVVKIMTSFYKWKNGRFLQCCGTGTGTVGTVTFCLVEPEPEP